MVPSPRKQAPPTPKKMAQKTPTKGTRSSPRKKAWGSPIKATAKFQSDIFVSFTCFYFKNVQILKIKYFSRSRISPTFRTDRGLKLPRKTMSLLVDLKKKDVARVNLAERDSQRGYRISHFIN